MGSMVVSRAVDRVFQPGRTKQKRIKLIFTASPWSLLSMQLQGIRANTSLLRNRIMCTNETTYLPLDCCLSEPAL